MVNNFSSELPFYNLSNYDFNFLLTADVQSNTGLLKKWVNGFSQQCQEGWKLSKLNFDYYDESKFNDMVKNVSKLIDISIVGLPTMTLVYFT